MQLTMQDMNDVLKNHSRADEAIFWFALSWNAGADSDLYRILCQTKFDPSLYRLRRKPGSTEVITPDNDPEIVYCHKLLRDQYERAFGPLREYPLRPIRFAEIKENDVVICGPGRQFACIEANWPCRVFKHHGDLGVPCAESPIKRSFHLFDMDPTSGYIVGFRR